jgi:hypothetical protein
MGNGNDFVSGFGDATIDGDSGFDTLSLGSYNMNDSRIRLGFFDNKVIFERNDISMTTTGFEQFTFNNESLTYNQLVAAL